MSNAEISIVNNQIVQEIKNFVTEECGKAIFTIEKKPECIRKEIVDAVLLKCKNTSKRDVERLLNKTAFIEEIGDNTSIVKVM